VYSLDLSLGAVSLKTPYTSRHSGLDPESPNLCQEARGIPGQARNDDADVYWVFSETAPFFISPAKIAKQCNSAYKQDVSPD